MRILISEKLSPHKFKTPEGYLICQDSVLARTGKQEYQKRDLFGDSCDDADKVVEVDRPEKEVFSDKTLASFENKPLTIEHPDEDVTIENHNDYAVGFVRDIKRGIDGGQPVMLGTLVITNQEAIEDVESGKYKELSCGYDCDIEDSHGYYQKNIRGNHVALCEHGRAGNARIVDTAIGDAGMVRGFFVNFQGKEFHKDFTNVDALISFARQVKNDGGKFIGSTSIPDPAWQDEESTYSKVTKELERGEKEFMKDDLIQSSSEEALKKNIATEIRSGKDPKQAAAIAYSVQRQNDAQNDRYEIVKERDHVVVYKNGVFWESADTREEAMRDIEEDEKQNHDSLDDSLKTVEEVQEGNIILHEGAKYRVSEKRKNPFGGFTLRVNSVEGPVKTEEIYKKANAPITIVDSVKDAFSDKFTIGWIYMDKNGEPYTGTTVVIGTKDIEKAKAAVKKEHPKVTGFTDIKKGNLGGEWADTIFVHDSAKDAKEVPVPESVVKQYQIKVDHALKMYGRIGAGLMDELDEHHLYVDQNNIVKRQVQDSIDDAKVIFYYLASNGGQHVGSNGQLTTNPNDYLEIEDPTDAERYRRFYGQKLGVNLNVHKDFYLDDSVKDAKESHYYILTTGNGLYIDPNGNVTKNSTNYWLTEDPNEAERKAKFYSQKTGHQFQVKKDFFGKIIGDAMKDANKAMWIVGYLYEDGKEKFVTTKATSKEDAKKFIESLPGIIRVTYVYRQSGKDSMKDITYYYLVSEDGSSYINVYGQLDTGKNEIKGFKDLAMAKYFADMFYDKFQKKLKIKTTTNPNLSGKEYLKDADKPEFSALGKWEWDEVVNDWYDTGRKMYYNEIVRNSKFDSLDLAKAVKAVKSVRAKDEEMIRVVFYTIDNSANPKFLRKGPVGFMTKAQYEEAKRKGQHVYPVGDDTYAKSFPETMTTDSRKTKDAPEGFDKDYAMQTKLLEAEVKTANNIFKQVKNKSASDIFKGMGYSKDGFKYTKQNGIYTRVIVFNDFDDIRYYVLKNGQIPSGWTVTRTKWYDSKKVGDDLSPEEKEKGQKALLTIKEQLLEEAKKWNERYPNGIKKAKDDLSPKEMAQKKEALVKTMLRSVSMNKLLDLWEATTTNRDPNIPTVRGWLMEEFERRNPSGYNKWLDDDKSTDKDLRKYMR